jgi:hypothetical protein
MNDDDMLPLELLFEDDGHLSEIALTAIADGQDAKRTLTPRTATAARASSGPRRSSRRH